jgi:hypothetical protein
MSYRVSAVIPGFGRLARSMYQPHRTTFARWYGVMERVDVSEEIDAVRFICFSLE